LAAQTLGRRISGQPLKRKGREREGETKGKRMYTPVLNSFLGVAGLWQ